MASVNRVTILGNLGRDPELRHAPNGSAVCNLSIATTRSWKSKDSGERQEETEWHRVVLFDRLAEVAGEYLKKGRSAYIEGRLRTRKWTDKDGVDKYTTEIYADQLQLLGQASGAGEDNAAPNRASAGSQGGTAPNAYANAKAGKPAPAAQSGSPGPDDGFSDSIPF